MGVTDQLGAEASKLRTLPATTLTVTGTVVAAALIAAALAASDADQQLTASAQSVVIRTVPYVQAGLVVLGVLPATHEYAGRQAHVSLLAVPARGHLLLAKTVALVVTAALTALAAEGAAVGAAVAARHVMDRTVTPAVGEPAVLLRVAAYLVLIALLAHAVAVLVHHQVPALVALLGTLLVLSPILAALGHHARWLPDRAGSQLYQHDDAVLSATTGTLVLLAWIVVIGAVGAHRFVARDA